KDRTRMVALTTPRRFAANLGGTAYIEEGTIYRAPAEKRLGGGVHWSGSDAEDHDFCGFDEGGGAFTGFEAHFSGRVGGDERSDVLFADAESDLGEEAAEFNVGDAADELIAAGDFAKFATASGNFAAIEFGGNEAVDF